MTDEKSSFSMYEELLAQETEHSDVYKRDLLGSTPLGKYIDGDEDCEDFVTSTEIVKTKEKLERKLGITTSDDGVIEESVHFKRYSKPREHKYTEREMIEIRNSCQRTIVHDYGEFDIYHISDEERARNDHLAEISMKLAKLKRTYRQVDQYIEAMRTVFEAWNLLEKKNYLHSKDEFYKMISDGRIVSNRIIMPKLKGMDKYNVDMIIRYISNPELDPSHLVPKKTERDHDSLFYEDTPYESAEDLIRRYLSEEEAEFIFNCEEPPRIEIAPIKTKYIKGYDRRSSKKKRKGNKREQYIKESLSEMLNKIQNGNHYKDNGNSYMVTHSLFEPQKKEKSLWDNLRFNGSWSDESAVQLYELMVNEELLKQNIGIGRERHLTYADKELQKFFKILEDNGVSVIELRRKIDVANQDSKKKERLTKKENKKVESAIIQRITKLNNDPKFKKITKKAEDALNNYKGDER